MSGKVKLILLEDVKDLGTLGDEVEVAPGYARNFLVRFKKAEPVTTAALRRIEKKKLQLQKEHEERLNVAKAIAEKLAEVTVVIEAAAGENDKLYGSVNAAQVAEALKSQYDIDLERTVIVLDEPIHDLGAYELKAKLHAEVEAVIRVNVVRKDAAANA